MACNRLRRGAGGGDAPLGRKRHIDLSACNKDYGCADGFYPSFVSVTGAQPRERLGALVAMAAHLEGKPASLLGFMGFAQKGWAVLTLFASSPRAERLHQVRIDAQQADAPLVCDLVVSATAEALLTVTGDRTRAWPTSMRCP